MRTEVKHVIAVVHRVREATNVRVCFQNLDVPSTPAQLPRSGQTGRTSAKHDNFAHHNLRDRAVVMTTAAEAPSHIRRPRPDRLRPELTSQRTAGAACPAIRRERNASTV